MISTLNVGSPGEHLTAAPGLVIHNSLAGRKRIMQDDTTEQHPDHPKLVSDTPDHDWNQPTQDSELGNRYYWLAREVDRG